MAGNLDRYRAIVAQSELTGIDFIYVHKDQVTLDIYFIRDPSTLTSPLSVNLGKVEVYNPNSNTRPMFVKMVGIATENGLKVLKLKASHSPDFTGPGDFSLYKLRIFDKRIDPFFNDVPFSFKANCPSDLDCKMPPADCPDEEQVDFPIDYSARDFWSYRRALLEFASLRYPDWPDRLASDAGVMLVETMSAVADEMSYYQDRVGREAYLETATQRRSRRHHTRLVDYTIRYRMGSTVWIDFQVNADGSIPAGFDIWAAGENGTRVDFEIGNNLQEAIKGKTFGVLKNGNFISAFQWDQSDVCLPVGSTSLRIQDHHAIDLKTFEGLPPGDDHGKWVLLKTTPANPAQPARAFMVRIISVVEKVDPIDASKYTIITWDKQQATPFELDLTVLTVHANMLPASSGKTKYEYIVVGDVAPASLITLAEAENTFALQTVEREGRDDTTTYLHTLSGSESDDLVWLPKNASGLAPEIFLERMELAGTNWNPVLNEEWKWKDSLIGVNSSKGSDRDYTIEDGSWRRVVGYWRNGTEVVHADYASANGTTIRFGDGEFGMSPNSGSVYRVWFRTGGGRIANVAPEAIINFDPAVSLIVDSIANPLNAIQGADEESVTETRQSAPEAFRTITYRAVQPPDYAEAAERLPWVQKAGASLRWTGSWLSMFVTADPLNAVEMTDVWRKDMTRQLDRYRQTGREVHTLEPQYADLDLRIEVCVAPDAYQGEVKERILEKLFGKNPSRKKDGFFSPDRFTFGEPLERSALEAAIQKVPGVKAIEYIEYRRRGVFDWKRFDEYYYDPGKNSIIRVENDLTHPERGILKLQFHGGA